MKIKFSYPITCTRGGGGGLIYTLVFEGEEGAQGD